MVRDTWENEVYALAWHHPSEWHHQKHHVEGFCERMKDYFATINGNYKWMHEHCDAEFTTKAMDGAAGNGLLDVVEWLHNHTYEGCASAAMDDAAKNGHQNVVEWLHKNRSEGCTTVAMDSAASKGFLKLVRWLHENRSEGCTTAAMDEAATNGHLDVVKFLPPKDARHRQWMVQWQIRMPMLFAGSTKIVVRDAPRRRWIMQRVRGSLTRLSGFFTTARKV